MLTYFNVLPSVCLPSTTPREDSEVPVEQHQVGRVLGHVSGGVRGDPDVGGAQRDHVVDPVPDEPDRATAVPQRGHDPGLMRGADLGEHRRALGEDAHVGVGGLIELATEHDLTDRHAHLGGDLGGDMAVVAGEDLDRHAMAS